MGPTLAGFLNWIRAVMGIPISVLPDDAAIIPIAYNVAIEICNIQLASLSLPMNDPAQPSIYALAVYNLGGSNLVNYAQDQAGQTPPPPNAATFWADLRGSFKISAFIAGVVSGAADQGTSETILTPDFMKTLTLANLQQLKDPWGRQYLSFVQGLGPLWGLS